MREWKRKLLEEQERRKRKYKKPPKKPRIHYFIGGGTVACGSREVHIATNDENVVRGPGGCCSCRRAAGLKKGRTVREGEKT